MGLRLERGGAGAVFGSDAGVCNVWGAGWFFALQFSKCERVPGRCGKSSDRVSPGGVGDLAALLFAVSIEQVGGAESFDDFSGAAFGYGLGGFVAMADWA